MEGVDDDEGSIDGSCVAVDDIRDHGGSSKPSDSIQSQDSDQGAEGNPAKKRTKMTKDMVRANTPPQGGQ